MQPDDFPRIDTTVPSIARGYAYMLGDEENSYEVDRQIVHALEDVFPGSFALARNHRRFLERVVRYLVADCGIRQFLDHGSGLPTRNNVHQVAKKAAPDARVRVIYLDIDPVVLAHQQEKALLADDNSTAFICEDARNTEAIFSHPETRRLIDLSEPVAAMWFSMLECIPDDEDPAGLVRRTMDRLPSGSYLVTSNIVADDPGVRRELNEFCARLSPPAVIREQKDVRAFFEGFDLVEPGMVEVTTWRPDGGEEEQTFKWSIYGGVARKS